MEQSGNNSVKSKTQVYELSKAMEDTIKRIQETSGVEGVMLFTPEGIPIKTTLDNTTAAQYEQLVTNLTSATRSVVRDLDPTNDLTFFRLRSASHEVLVAPDDHFLMLVLQNSELSGE